MLSVIFSVLRYFKIFYLMLLNFWKKAHPPLPQISAGEAGCRGPGAGQDLLSGRVGYELKQQYCEISRNIMPQNFVNIS
jgi:hypothetical protein